MNAQRAFVLAVLSIAAWSWLGSRKGGRSKGRSTAMGSVGHAPAQVIRIGQAKPRHPWLRAGSLWAGRRLVRAVHTQPRRTMWASIGLGVVTCAGLLVAGWPTVLAYAPLAPASVITIWAALSQHKRSGLDGNAAIWARLSEESIGPDGKPRKAQLAGSRVKGRVVYEREGDVVRRFGLLVRGWDQATTFARIAAERESIAAAYLVPAKCVEVVRHEDEAHAMVWVTTREWMAHVERTRAERLRATYPLGAQVLDRATGACEVGVQLVSGEPAYWEAFRPGVGARHGVVAGDTRFGKSTYLETLASVMLRSGWATPCFIDLAGGVTFDEWRDRSIGFADNVKDAAALMRRLDAEFEGRVREIKARGWRGVWRFSEQDPFIPVFVDEGPELKASKEASGLLARAVRQYAKAGIGVIFASQSLTIESILGSDAGSVAKSQLMAGNLTTFYSNQGQARLPFDISDLPPVAGVAKTYGPLHYPEVLIKGLYAEDIPGDLRLPAFRWREEPVLSGPTSPSVPSLSLVLSEDPTERVRDALSTGPLTIADIAKATRLNYQKVQRLIETIPGVTGDGAKYGQKWSLS